MNRKDVTDKAVSFFISKKYQIQTQTDNVLVFETHEREVNWLILIVLCCLGIVPAIIYYYVFSPKHTVTVSMTGDKDVVVTVTGNTDKAKKDAAEFKAHVG